MNSALKIEAGKIYITRAGNKVRILETDVNNSQPIVALLTLEGGKEEANNYGIDGSFLSGGVSSRYDIVAEWSSWSDVPIDTKIRVRDALTHRWENRHFAGWDAAKKVVKAWDWGKTSHTVSSKEATAVWQFAEIVE